MLRENDGCFSWPEYYNEFPYFSEKLVRPGCQPQKYIHPGRAAKAIVLIHGLTDSPYYMRALADYFHNHLGYNVYLPLLHCHGLKDPALMAGVSLDEWKKNVRFALHQAAAQADRISIGGLSTGGALGFYLGCLEPEVTGDIYLFSAALGLALGRFEIVGAVKLFLLRSPVFDLGKSLESNAPLVAEGPYRYNRVPLNSARELALLIEEIEQLLKEAEKKKLEKRIFAAWSEFDHVINKRTLMDLEEVTAQDQFASFIIDKALEVDHACVVLQEPVFATETQPDDPPLEKANPVFDEMLAALKQFESVAR